MLRDFDVTNLLSWVLVGFGDLKPFYQLDQLLAAVLSS